jgi:hypothetical protein
VERLGERGIVVRTAPLTEWLLYSDYCVVHGLASNTSQSERLRVRLNQVVKGHDQLAIEHQLVRSGYFLGGGHHISQVVRAGSRLVNPALATEASLTVGSTLLELGEKAHGVISIGPFGCMPCRIAEAVLNGRLESEMSIVSKHMSSPGKSSLPLPFLTIETDGNAFPQLLDARLEIFLLAAQRLRDGLKKELILSDTTKIQQPVTGQTTNSRGGSKSGTAVISLER